MTPAQHKVEAEKCLHFAAAADTGSYSEDINLRFALVHAILANVKEAQVTWPEPPEVAGVPIGSKFNSGDGEFEVTGTPVWDAQRGHYMQRTRCPDGDFHDFFVPFLRAMVVDS